MVVQVERKARHLIKPAEKTWTGTLKLSELDMTFVNIFESQLCIYNGNKETSLAASRTDTLKASLAKVLVHFYPFTGRLRPTATGVADMLELHVDDDLKSGVPLVEAEAHADLADLGHDLMEADVQGRLTDLFCTIHDPNKPLHELPLMMVQITHFRCGGIAVAFTLSHVIVDGTAAANFLTEWTRIARGEPLQLTPIYDRTSLSTREPPKSIREDIKQRVVVDQASLPQTTVEMFRVSKSQIDKLKQIAGHVINDRPYTRFEVLAAHIWRCISKATENIDRKVTTLAVYMDIRKRVNPPLPQEFFGPAVILTAVASEYEDLISKPLAYPCNNIRKSLKKVNSDAIWGYLDYVKDLGVLVGAITPEGDLVNPDIRIMYLLNLSLNKLDFGWGNETYMACPIVKKDGRVIIRAGDEDGSAIVTICLQATHMDKFKCHFFHQLGEGLG